MKGPEDKPMYILVAGFNLDILSITQVAHILNEFQVLHRGKRIEFKQVPLDTSEKHLERCREENVIGVLLPPKPPVVEALEQCPDLPHVVPTPNGLMHLTGLEPQLTPFCGKLGSP